MKAPNSLTRTFLPTLPKKPLLLLLLLVSGTLLLSVCQNKPNSLPEKPLYPLFLPEGDSQWLKEIADGFQQSARQFGAEVLIFRYSFPTLEALLKASEGRAPWSVPWCVVFRRKKEIADVVSALSERGIGVITIGADDPGTNRIGHVGDNTQRWTHLWRVRVKQAFPKARKFLFVFGDFPLKDERLTGEILARSGQGAVFEVRFVDLGTFKEEDARWCDVVVAVGRDAIQFSEKSIPRPVFPVDGDDRTLQGVAEGKFRFLLVPRTFEYGVRAFRLAREYFLQRALEKPVIALEPYEVDATFVEEYRHRRYQLPSVPAPASP